MRQIVRAVATVVVVLAVAPFAPAAQVHVEGAVPPADSAGISPPAVSASFIPGRSRQQQFSMSVATISPGAMLFKNGSFAIVGQAFAGTISNGEYTMQVGAVAMLSGGANILPGDADGDGDVDLDDHLLFTDCMSGPDAMPNPTAPTTVQKCLDVFDTDRDDDVDLFDAAEFAVAFNGG